MSLLKHQDKAVNITDFHEKMIEITKEGDFEMRHGDQDFLLVDLIEYLALSLNKGDQKRIVAILDMYKKSEKWYA